MAQASGEVIRHWRLASRDRRQLLSAGAAQRGDTVAMQCLDIDRALLWLLGDRETVRRWLRQPNAAFYHATPLTIALGSTIGRRRLRHLLLEEAALARDDDAMAALAPESL